MEYCQVCKHTANHAPREEDDGIKPPYCPGCVQCSRRRKSLKEPFPSWFAALTWKVNRQ
jgi:hypothetical protein